MTLSDKQFKCFVGLCLVERQLAVGFFPLSMPDMIWSLIQHLSSILRICNSSYSVYVCLDTDAGSLFISAAAEFIGWVHRCNTSSCGKQEWMHGHKHASCSVVCDWAEIHFQYYCIHLAFWIFPAIWFQSLMAFVEEDASYESRISDGCWTCPMSSEPCRMHLKHSSHRWRASQLAVPKMLCSKGKKITRSFGSNLQDCWFLYQFHWWQLIFQPWYVS